MIINDIKINLTYSFFYCQQKQLKMDILLICIQVSTLRLSERFING